MIKPNYQEIPRSKIPEALSPDRRVAVKVIASEAPGVRAVIETRTPMMHVHFSLQPKSEIEQQVPAEYNAFAYVVNGQGLIGSNKNAGARGQVVIFSNTGGDTVSIKNKSDDSPLDVLLIARIPLNEPVARHGPFVMNEPHEIEQAVEDYRSSKVGQISY
jgi:redox-sensitive bicupin YhaK (pirin superfamily)